MKDKKTARIAFAYYPTAILDHGYAQARPGRAVYSLLKNGLAIYAAGGEILNRQSSKICLPIGYPSLAGELSTSGCGFSLWEKRSGE